MVRATMTGIGTRANPFDLASALAAAHIRGGDSVRLLDGTYSGDFSGALNGTQGSPIVVRPDSGATVKINGALDTTGMVDVEFHGLEITAEWNGSRDYLKSTVPHPGSKVVGTRVKLINCVIHDIAQLDFFSDAIDCELYGCVIYNCGVSSDDRTRVHNLYAQNATGTKKITNCIFHKGFSQFIVHAYAESGGLVNFQFTGNVIADGIFLIGGQQPITNLVMTDNYFHSLTRIGYDRAVEGQTATITGNRFGWSLELYSLFQSLEMTGNELLHSRPFYLYPPMDVAYEGTYDIDNNEYVSDDLRFTVNSMGEQNVYMGLSNWQAAHGHDGNSTQEATLSDYDGVTVQANAYDSGRAHIIVHNNAGADSVEADVSAILNIGDGYRLRNSQDYYGDVQAGTVAGDGTITIDMQAVNRSVAVPTDYHEALAVTTFPAFGALVLERTA